MTEPVETEEIGHEAHTPNCAMCGLDLEDDLVRHHLVPRAYSRPGVKRDWILIHTTCHRLIHSSFATRELAKQTWEQLRSSYKGQAILAMQKKRAARNRPTRQMSFDQRPAQ